VVRLGWTLAGIAVFLLYLVTNQLSVGREALTLATPLDRAIPFVPVAIVVYSSIYLFLFLPVLQIRDLALFSRTAKAFCVYNGLSLLVFVLVPVQVERPEVVIDSLWTWGVAFNYACDPPYNSFPSMHVSNAVFATLIALRLDPPVGRVTGAWALAIIASTLLIKQHWIVDLVAGGALGWAGYRFGVLPAIPRDAAPGALVFPRRYLSAVVVAYWCVIVGFSTGYFLGWRPFD
jgi:membrane-associated phospholipid phosphatase